MFGLNCIGYQRYQQMFYSSINRTRYILACKLNDLNLMQYIKDNISYKNKFNSSLIFSRIGSECFRTLYMTQTCQRDITLG